MALGISTACFYPAPTEEALRMVAQTGAKVTEVFFNAPSELESGFLKELSRIKDDNGIRIRSVHPFTSFAEGYILFSQCERRFRDYREFYKKYYAAASAIGAKIVVLHGAKMPVNISTDEYAERLGLLVSDAREQGIILAQENVVHHNGQTPELMNELKSRLGVDFHMVLDIKQAYLAGVDPIEFFREFSDNICHIHLSDHDENRKCIPPFDGNFDFAALFSLMKENKYSGDCVIELYRSGFERIDQLTDSMYMLKRLC